MTLSPARRRSPAIVATLLGALLVLTACTSDQGSPGTTTDPRGETRRVEADNGTFEVPAAPERVVAISWAVGPVIQLGIEPVGINEAPFFSDENQSAWFTEQEAAAYENAEIVGVTLQDIDLEAIAALEPDLIVLAFANQYWDQWVAEKEEEYQAIAPTVYFASSAEEWRTVDGRIAEAVGKSEEYEKMGEEYDALVAEMKEEFAPEIDSLSFAQLTRYATTPDGQVWMVASSGARYPNDVGFEFADCSDGTFGCALSLETLSELSENDILIYPLGSDGEPNEEFLPVLESNIWNALPQVVEGHAVGVEMPSNMIGIKEGVVYLNSLRDALRSLPN